MRSSILLSFLVLALISCNYKSAPTIRFDNDTLNFGTIVKGDSAVAHFWFKNAGNSNLQIINVGTTCNCSAVDFPKGVIASDNKGCITIRYNNSLDSRVGNVSKTIVVETNCKPSIYVLTLMGSVTNL